MELHAGHLTALHDRRERLAVRRDRDRVAGDRRDVAVREVDLRAGRRRRRAIGSSRCMSSVFQPTCGTFRSPAVATAAARVAPAAEQPEARADPAPRRCLRTATACRGRCRAADAARRRARESRRPIRGPSAAVAAKWPTPGTMMRVARPRARRAVPACTARRRARASAFRTDVRLPAPVVDQRDHSRSFGARQHLRQPLVLRARDAQRAGERLEHRLDLVMARAAVQHLDVDVGAGADRESLEEIVHELGLQVADQPHLHLEIDDGVRPAAEIDRRDGERLVHRHDEVAGAVDALAVAERLRHRLAERDAEILDRVVLVDVEIARRVDRRDRTRRAARRARACDRGTGCRSAPGTGPCLRASASARSASRSSVGRLPRGAQRPPRTRRCSASCVRRRPAPMRRQPSHPGSLDRLRRNMPARFGGLDDVADAIADANQHEVGVALPVSAAAADRRRHTRSAFDSLDLPQVVVAGIRRSPSAACRRRRPRC